MPPWRPFRRRLVPRLACASRTSCELARGASVRYRQQPQPRLVAAQSHHPPALAAVGSVRRDAETGLALLLLVLAAALHKLETAANKLAKLVAEEAPGTLSLLKLSFLEVNDLTSQLKNLRKSLTISRFGKQASTKASSRT
uniref:Uncharacterized protein n=1 Tax=Setaria italica TaxID=4555 RepID=K3ZD98_SETIT